MHYEDCKRLLCNIAVSEDYAVDRNLMERFSEACGAAGPLLVDVEDDGAVHRARRIVRQPFLICGRHPDADVELQNEQVGRRHCYVQTVGGRLFALDLGSRAGLVVDGTECRAGWLDGLRELRLGPVGLRMRGGDGREHASLPESPSPLSADYAKTHPMPAVTLEVSNGGARPQSWSMSRVMVLIGRAPTCQLRLHSPLVSEVHCALLRTKSGVWLIDLLSHGGVYVDDMATRIAYLAEGAEIGIGPFTVRIRYDAGGDSLVAAELSETSPHFGDLPICEDDADRLASLQPFEEPASMPDQLRQVLMMSRVVAAMHRDHRDAMDEELRELRGLAEELRGLRDELSSRRVATRDVASPFESLFEDGDAESAGFRWHDEVESILRNAMEEVPPSLGRATSPMDSHAFGRVADHRSRAEPARGSQRDPQVLHAIATEFLAAYRLESRNLRAKLVRILLGSHDSAMDLTRPSR
ncbi:FHA domain-containing protein [Singulisphaera sp. GP187]|uniref:FHA domain-containing protein n=1 Tax=Singulisphaera sp. GP187 TaxID=1882752 RepID=UPI000929BB76|nr:FHA domain-containing protein [Singulisphaera sp. GP187]SIO09250.1 FHA domain-containing protein [Singulisphaera sp. GP187]